MLARHGILAEPTPARSTARFPDGADFRIEIPSVEGPAVMRAVVEAAAEGGVTINRVSQGSGAMLLSGAELAEMAGSGRSKGWRSRCSSARGRNGTWAARAVREGPSRGGRMRGARQLRYAMEDVLRGVEQRHPRLPGRRHRPAGTAGQMQGAGQIPESVVWKVSAVMAPPTR